MKKPLFVTAIILFAPMIHAAFLTLAAPAALSINPVPLPAAIQSQTYTAPALTVSGGAPPYTWSIAPVEGTLPEGIAINSSTGIISASSVGGQGGFQFQVQVKDSTGTIATALETINVAARNAVSPANTGVTSPPGPTKLSAVREP